MYTLQGNTRPTRHTISTLSLRMAPDHTYFTWFTCSNLSCSHQQSWVGALLPRKRASNTIHRFTGLYPISLPIQPIKQWGQNQLSVGRLLSLLGLYHRHTIGTFNTCSWGPTHRSLTDTSGGYSLRGVSLPRITPRPFQSRVSTFHLSVSPGL
jgi:hypothetical protein